MSANLEWCPAWLAYLGALLMWLLLISAGKKAIIQGYELIDIKHEFEQEATQEQCLLIDYDTHICDCGMNCNLWSHEYFAITDKCPNQTLSTNQEGDDPCDYNHYLPLPINETYIECYVLDCSENVFSLEREFATQYDPYEMIIGGIILLTCFDVSNHWSIIYTAHKLTKNINYHRLVPD